MARAHEKRAKRLKEARISRCPRGEEIGRGDSDQ